MAASFFGSGRWLLGGLVASVCTLAGSAGAQTVLFDFGNDASFRGVTTANPDFNGNHWNSFRTGVFYQDLIDSQDQTTTIDFGFSTPVATDSYNGPAGATDAATIDTDVFLTDIDSAALGALGGSLAAAFDFIAGPSLADNSVRFEIQQLDPAKAYDLTFFGSHKYSTDASTVYSVYTDNTYTTLVDSVSLDIQDLVDPSLHNRDSVATLSGLRPQESDILYVQFIGSSGAEGYLNAMELVGYDAPRAQGDFNGDGLVDAADYTVWRDNYGESDAVLGGAGDDSGTVDDGDYTVWSGNYGGAGPAAVATPEPLSAALLLIAACGRCAVSGRRR